MSVKKINYNDRRFIGVENYDNGEFTKETIFHYHQKGDIVWGTYKGGGVRLGMLIGTVDIGGSLDMRWQHVNLSGQLKTGKCRSKPEILLNRRIRLYESWETTNGSEVHGESIVEELRTHIARGNKT